MECRERTGSEQRQHLAAIAAIVERWHSGEITMGEKRELIARENAFFDGRHGRLGRTGRSLTADTGEHARLPSHADEDRDHWWQETG